MFGVMTAVFTRRLRLFILLFLAEGLETSASFALSFRFFSPFSQLDLVPGVRAPLLLPLPPSNPQGRLVVEPSTQPEGKERGNALDLGYRCTGGTFSPKESYHVSISVLGDWERGWFLVRMPVTCTLRVSGFPPPGFPSPSTWPSRDHFRLRPSPPFPHLLLPEAQSTLDLRIQSSSQRWVPKWLSCLCSTSANFPSSHWRFYKANIQNSEHSSAMWQPWGEGALGENGYMYMYGWVPLAVHLKLSQLWTLLISYTATQSLKIF